MRAMSFFTARRRPEFFNETLVVETVQLRGSQILGSYCHFYSPPSRRTMRAFNGSLWIARRRASRANSSLTPESSKRTRPGFTFETNHYGETLPEPIRV